MPGMPMGKPAGVRCKHLSDSNLCLLFSSDQRPAVCADFAATDEFCGENRQQALKNLAWLEKVT